MIDRIERGDELDAESERAGSWGAVLSAWALVVLFLLLLAGVSAVACPRPGSHPPRHLAGAVIPQHDPCVGPGLASAPDTDGCKNVPLTWANYANYW